MSIVAVGTIGYDTVETQHGSVTAALGGSVSYFALAARFFAPQLAGVPIVPPTSGVFRIDHDEKFNQTTHLQYQPWKRGPWVSLNWRFDSGLVAGATPCFGSTVTCSASTPIANGGTADIPSGQVALVNTVNGPATDCRSGISGGSHL